MMIVRLRFRTIRRCFQAAWFIAAAIAIFTHGSATEPERSGEAAGSQLQLERDIQPILTEHCYACHADGESKGNFSLDQLIAGDDLSAGLHKEPNQDASNKKIERSQTWYRVLRQLRAGLMPPMTEPRPEPQDIAKIEQWIKRDALNIPSDSIDPGRATLRRLNRIEYRNTIRELMGVEYDTALNFPADDTGHGFDNIGDVLSISPLLLEKYVDAAKDIVRQAVPTSPAVVAEKKVYGSDFKLDSKPQDSTDRPAVDRTNSNSPANMFSGRRRPPQRDQHGNGPLELSYYVSNTARAKVDIEHAGSYTLQLNMRASESYVDNQFDLNKCRFTFSVDGEQLLSREFVRQGGKDFSFEFDREWEPGDHEFVVQMQPLSESDQIRNLRLSLQAVVVVGPHGLQHFVKPPRYDQFFPRTVPSDVDAQRDYARELLTDFVTRAYRRPADPETVERLIGLAEQVQKGKQTFETGIATAMTAILASPSFLFREEFVLPDSDADAPLVDEFTLASRLSYLLWSSMPDQELFQLAKSGQLRSNLDDQVTRMLADKKSAALFENFTGQWLQSRAIETVQINARSVVRREEKRDEQAEERRRRFFELFRKGQERTAEESKEFEELQKALGGTFRNRSRLELTNDLRRSMRRETEMLFEHIVRNDRSLLELIDADYTFLDETLANHYQIEGISGDEMRRVELPEDSVRGGVLTQGVFLIVTSNPDRTSPVKRGLFILDNLLGIPTAAPPPDIPTLEQAAAGDKDAPKSLRETLEIHRSHEACSSCHNRMDPLGLAFENFNALGRFREMELEQKISPEGTLVTGESFTDVRELKKILSQSRSQDFYRCVTEKLLTYALGRAVEVGDVETVDQIVDKLKTSDGSAITLLNEVIRSAPFQRRRSGA